MTLIGPVRCEEVYHEWVDVSTGGGSQWVGADEEKRPLHLDSGMTID